MLTPRWYQSDSSEIVARRLRSGPIDGAILVVIPTGGGKSLCLALAVSMLDGPSLILQPSREILRQNYQKLLGYEFKPAIYSASLGKRQISGAVTLATIASIARKPGLFEYLKYVLIDEAHLCNPAIGLYKQFFDALAHRGIRIAAYTATPYRLMSTPQGAMLKFLTRIQPPMFSEVAYYVQNGRLFSEGHLAKLQYHQVQGFDRGALQANSTGADYTDASIQVHFRATNFTGKVERVVRMLIDMGRKSILVFTRFVADSRRLAELIPGSAMVSAETPSIERDRILRDFKSGKIKVIFNACVLIVGFDFPELDTVLLAAPTLSLARYYQEIGRAIRPHPSKPHAMVVDMVGLVEQFGKVEDLRIERDSKNRYYVASNGKQLTNVVLKTIR